MKIRFEINDIISFFALVILFIAFGIACHGKLYSSYNLSIIIDQAIPIILGGLGTIFVISQGSVDLSIGGTAAVAATVGAMVSAKIGFITLFPVTIIIGLGIGCINGFIISKFKVSSFMTTLAMLIALRGLLNFLLTKGVVYAPEQAAVLNIFSIKFLILIIAILIMGYLFEFTKIGFYSKAIGENEMTSKSIGIHVDKIKIVAFILSGLMASIVGIIQLTKVGGSSSTLGQFFEMRVMMGIFLGGVMVTGGMTSKIYKIILGALTIVIIENGLILSRVDGAISEAVQGILLMTVLFVTIYFNSRRIKTKKRVIN